jgi:tellurite resistance protein TehA-like permease
MGTGIVAVLLHNLPYNARWLYWLSIVIFILNVVLLGLFLAVSLARYIIWPGSWTAMIHHPEQSLFLGAVPISLGTIVSMICYVCVDTWGAPVQYLAMTLWVIEVLLSIMCEFFVPFLLISRTDGIDLSGLTACYLFPAISCVVASASGSVVASAVSNAQHALWTIIISYVLWGVGVPMAMLILVIYFHRLVIHKLPPRELLVSVFIPIGKLRCLQSMLMATHIEDQVPWAKAASQY